MLTVVPIITAAGAVWIALAEEFVFARSRRYNT
jgi:hypothetical protein